MNSNMVENLIDLEVSKRLAKFDFYEYCQYREPEFYTLSRTHLKILCDILNDFYYNKLLKEDGDPYSKLMIRMPPQHGKTRTLVNFTQWCLGKNNKERIISASYNDTQASEYARFTRDGIQEVKNTKEQRVFSDVFNSKIKQGNASYQKWALEGEHFNYLGIGVGGGVTGKGATIRIIDDLVKDAEIAVNDNALQKIWLWYSGTYSSRNSADGGEVKEIFCATLWNEKDPQGILEKDEKEDWYILQMEVYNKDTDQMLCDDFLNKKAYLKLKDRMIKNPITASIFWANYHSKKVSIGGRLYKNFKTYSEISFPINYIKSYTDSADQGDDYLCSIIYTEHNNLKYVLEVIYTQEPNEITEELVARKFKEYNVNKAIVESNAGGRSFARNVERITRDKKNLHTIFEWFYQSKNKEARIKSNSSTVQNIVVFPDNWNIRWKNFYEDVTSYMASGKNSHDDAPDVLTGIVENIKDINLIEKKDIDRMYGGVGEVS